ncbi:alpha/beta hydrolase [Neorhizobium lilium]|uniref:Alpha/beta hydrolase n=1 Tax=Neorhizobium lilium TaxID=2503024 RepID=A0A444LFF6_9HYPH|nr:alpha/beta hydrolase [Neorhizobium lilium]RWX76922.1 alpha/beta hydrolase [Neorhizobium lilium]
MPTRRTILAAISLAALFPRGPLAAGPAPLALWPSTPPGGGGPPGPIRTRPGGAVRNVSAPSLEVFQAEEPNGMAVLIAAGGGYRRIQNGNEALPAARWLNAHGITAFVLTYRLPGEGWAAGPLAPLQDAQRAIRVIRAGASRFDIHADRIGVLGFSAGGHLLGLAATRSTFITYERVDATDQISARPDFAALIYPIITLKPPYDRTSSRKMLVGEHPDPALTAEWSVEEHVKANCPPMFLAQAKDDPVSDPHNTLLMQAACEQAGIPVELLQLDDGGHGFGMGRPGTASMAWPDAFASWLAKTVPS